MTTADTQYAIRSTQYAQSHVHHASTFDIYFVGVGGQGVLTIGEIITETAFRKGIPVNFYPTKGMAQRGGFVKAQLRLGRAAPGAGHPRKGRRPGDRHRGVRGAQGRALRQAGRRLRALRPRLGADRGDAGQGALSRSWTRWPQPLRATLDDGSRFIAIPPDALPLYEGAPVPDNIFTLGVALGRTRLGELLPPAEVEVVVRGRWKRGVERNMLAFAAGLAFAQAPGVRDAGDRGHGHR